MAQSTGPFATLGGMNEPAAGGRDTDRRARREPADGPGMRTTGVSGGKGLAIILGAMLGIIGLLWLVAVLVAPH